MLRDLNAQNVIFLVIQGGPLFVDGIQIGIVSWSLKPCEDSSHPGELKLIIFLNDYY